MTQPEALRLADEMESNGECMNAAAELRRLQSLNTELLAALKKAYHAMVHLELSDSSRQEWEDARTTAHGAIARAEGEAK
jgi:hypothetical protein